MTGIVLSGRLRGRLASASDGGPYFDPVTRMTYFDSHPLKVTSNAQIKPGNTADDLSGIFANWRLALTLFEREEVNVMAYEETEPGFITFYAQGRFVPVIAMTDAIAGLVTRAS